MNETEDNRALLIAVFIMVMFNGLLLSANGVFMLIAPAVGMNSCQA
jgi:hypothetical protein